MQTDSTVEKCQLHTAAGRAFAHDEIIRAMQRAVDRGVSEDGMASVALDIAIMLLAGNQRQSVLPAPLLGNLVACRFGAAANER